MGRVRVDFGQADEAIRQLSISLGYLQGERERVRLARSELYNIENYYYKADVAINDFSYEISQIDSACYRLEDFIGSFRSFVNLVRETDKQLAKKFNQDVKAYCKAKEIEITTWYDKLLDKAQFALDIVGFIPGIGEIADLINGVISLLRGDFGTALICFIAMVPLIGDSLKVLKYTDEAAALLKMGDKALGIGKSTIKNGIKKASAKAKKEFVKLGGDSVKNVLKESIDLGSSNFFVKLKNGADFTVSKAKDGLSTVTCDILGIYCFTGETLVQTEQGLKKIKNITEKDKVLSKNEDNKEISYKKVKEIHIGSSYEICTIDLENDKIETTTGHLFMVKNKWWVSAINIEPEDEIETSKGVYEKVKSVNVEKLSYPRKIYNLTVEDNHTYYVGANELLVHNTKKCKVPEGVGKGIEEIGEGQFKITNWEGYPEGPKPDGPFKVLEGEEYNIARKQANNANADIHKQNPSLKGMQIHEVQPVKFGGSPTDISNKIHLTTKEHAQYTTWWNKLLKELKK